MNYNKDNRLYKILKIIEKSNLTSSKSIAEKLGVSIKTVNNEIKNLNKLLKKTAVIDVKDGKNVIYVIDSKNFQIIREKLEVIDDFFNSQQNRMSYILYKLMYSKTPYLTDDLADEMKISKTTMSNDLKKLRIEMESYDLQVVGKTNKGLFLEGNELNIRMFFLQNINQFLLRELKVDEQVKEYIFSIFNEIDLGKEDTENFINFFAIMFDRLKNSYEIKTFDKLYLNLKQTKTFEFVNRVLNGLENIVKLKIPLNERLFMVIPLVSMRTPINYYNIKVNKISNETIELVEEILSFIKKEMNITIVSGEFLEEFIHHVYFMINRIRFGIKIKNLILEDIKEKYLVAYKMAEISMEIIEEKIGKKVSKEEVGYIAMYFGVFMSENLYKNTIKRVAIICIGSVLTARLVLSQIKKYCQKFNILIYTHLIQLIMSC